MKRLHFPDLIKNQAIFTIDQMNGQHYDLKIFNICGEEVYSRFLGGQLSFIFERGNLIGGVYFVQVTNQLQEVVYHDTIILV